MNKPFKMLIVFYLGVFLLGCLCFAPGSQSSRDATADIQVFVDANRNAIRDVDETALPEVLIVSRSNIHGNLTYSAQLTDSNGEASISTSYTHFFDIVAFSPCGYEATTPTSVKAKKKLVFGFAPLSPRSGSAQIHIQLWHDDNQDGIRQENESPISEERLFLDPGLPWSESWSDSVDTVTGALTTETDSSGQALVNLGNSCGQVDIIFPKHQWQLTTPTDAGIWGEGYYRTPFQPGMIELSLGLLPQE
jgi:hypothetical protein